jgi:AraC-like DNA-binding protein
VEFVRRNVAHGLLLTLAERKRAAVRVLRAHPAWSDRRVAALCGVSSKTVARVRVEAGVCPTGDGASIDGGMRVGRDGRCRPVRRGSVRARVLEALRADPSASLRAIASVAEVSPETVRLVRMNMAEVEASSGDEPAAAASWRDDAALVSCEEGEEFVGWFERTLVGVEDLARAGAVPLSRVYEVGDEARRRSEAWLEFARALEARTTRTR